MVMVLSTPASDPRPYRALGRRVAELRQRAGISQAELARRANISEGYPTLIETGRNRPDPVILRRIAEELDAEYAELAGLAGFADMLTDDDWQRVPPRKRGVLKRLADRYSTVELSRFEEALAALFLKRPADTDAQQEGADDGHEDHPEPGTDSDDGAIR